PSRQPAGDHQIRAVEAALLKFACELSCIVTALLPALAEIGIERVNAADVFAIGALWKMVGIYKALNSTAIQSQLPRNGTNGDALAMQVLGCLKPLAPPFTPDLLNLYPDRWRGRLLVGC